MASKPSSPPARRVADVGCGHGASTLLLAEAYPASTVVGFDAHDGSIDAARKRAADAGLADRVRFEVASATTFDGELRPGLLLRLPARHGRPGRRLRPRPRPPRPRRDAHADRALRQRRPGRQPHPGRRRLLRVLHPALHPELAVPGRRHRARRPGRRGPASRHRHRRRLHNPATSSRNTLQHRARSQERHEVRADHRVQDQPDRRLQRQPRCLDDQRPKAIASRTVRSSAGTGMPTTATC